LIDAFNRGRRDDAVESGRRAAADQNSESAFAHLKYVWLLVENVNAEACVNLEKNSISFLPQ
jgi:hypothetical protein